MVSSVSDLCICFLPGHTISQAGQDLWCQHSDLSRSTSACKCMKNPNLSTMNLTIELLPKIAKAQFTKSTARTESWIHIKELLCSVQTLLGVSTRSKLAHWSLYHHLIKCWNTVSCKLQPTQVNNWLLCCLGWDWKPFPSSNISCRN